VYIALLGVCQSAAVPLVAVRTWLREGVPVTVIPPTAVALPVRAPANVVAEAVPEIVKPERVPTEVSEEVTTLEAKVVPVSELAATEEAVVDVVAVAALPEILILAVPAEIFPGVKLVSPAPLPLKVVPTKVDALIILPISVPDRVPPVSGRSKLA
jgi:hypothetical protein